MVPELSFMIGADGPPRLLVTMPVHRPRTPMSDGRVHTAHQHQHRPDADDGAEPFDDVNGAPEDDDLARLASVDDATPDQLRRLLALLVSAEINRVVEVTRSSVEQRTERTEAQRRRAAPSEVGPWPATVHQLALLSTEQSGPRLDVTVAQALRSFRRWLAADPPQRIRLSVESGPAGSGLSA